MVIVLANKSKVKKIKTNKSAILISFIAFFALTYLSILTHSMGAIGDFFTNLSFKAFGIGSYIVYPLIIIDLLLALIKKLNPKTLKISILAYTMIVIFLAIIDLYSHSPKGLSEKINSHLLLADSLSGVGVIGASISYLLNFTIGKLGTSILFSLVVFAFILSIFNLNVKDFFKISIESLISTFNKLMNLINKLMKNYMNFKQVKKSKIHEEKKEESLDFITPYKVNEDNETSLDDNISISNYREKYYEEEQLSIENLDIEIKATSNYSFPPIELLKQSNNINNEDDRDLLLRNAEIIEDTLDNFNISSKVVQVNRGPRVTSYELQPAGGVKVSSIVNLQDNLALSLATSGIRIEAPIPGKAAVGIEVPNKSEDAVFLKDIINSAEFKNTSYKIPFSLGKDIAGNSIVTGIEQMPHLLIAGATGSGKSVCINTLITSILYSQSPDTVKLILIDPKMVELNVYNGIPHLVIPVVTDPKKASAALNWAVREMERRYEIFSNKSVRDIKSYKENFNLDEDEDLPYIVIIIDELSDLMMVAASEVEDHISRLAQMSRACGIHLVIATQRPSVDVITGTIKANIPSRISFAVSSQIDSRTILDMAGAEKLLGKGDMLFYPSNYMKPVRIQGAFVTDTEVENIVKYIKNNSKAEYDHSVMDEIKSESSSNKSIDSQDDLLSEAIEIVIREQQASVSLLQRRLQVGYARAGRIIDQMEDLGVIEGHQGSKPRKVLVDHNILEEGCINEYSE